MSSSHRIAPIILVLCIRLLAYKSHSRGEPSDFAFALDYRPSSSVGDFGVLDLTAFQGSPVVSCALYDSTGNGSAVGRNTEQTGNVRVVKTRSNRLVWAKSAIVAAAKSFGIEVVVSDSCNSRFVRGTITRMWVEEGRVYKADFALRLEAVQDGQVIWSGIVADASTRWGSSLTYALYSETLSNAIMGTAYKLLSNGQFAAAFQRSRSAVPKPE
jgi:hypothetical protein